MLPTRRQINRLISESNNMRQSTVKSRHGRINRGLIAETGIIPAGLQLIRDSFRFDVVDKKNVVKEDRQTGGEMPVMIVKGLIQQGNTENANGRYYSTKDVLIPAVEDIQEDLASRAVLGECDHPQDAKIHLDRVSHLITKVWMEGNKVYGEAEILHKLPFGALIRGLFEHKARVGISSRGVGDMELTESNGREIYNVLGGYTFVTWDIVAEPSVSGAILNINEGLVKKLRPIQQQQRRNPLSQQAYNNLLVKEIDKYFGLK